VIVAPNSDFVRMPEVRAEADEKDVRTLQSRDIRVFRSVSGESRVRVRFTNMALAARAAVLAGLTVSLTEWLRSNDNPVHHGIATHLENLGISDLELWAWNDKDVTEVIDERPYAVVLDLGGFSTSLEPQAAALAVLDHLWERRADRVGRLIVIDEAHNLCPPEPATAIQRLLTDRIVQIAAEGRKC
jgi:hypothetical protein